MCFIVICFLAVSIKSSDFGKKNKENKRKVRKRFVFIELVKTRKYMLVVCGYGLIAAAQLGFRILVAL